MFYITLRDQGASGDVPPLGEGAKLDIAALDAALADPSTRAFAEAALTVVTSLVSDWVKRGAELSEPETDPKRTVLRRLGIDARPMSGAEFLGSAPVVDGLKLRARVLFEAVPLAEAARRLGVTDGRLRQRISDKSLMGIRRPHGRKGWLIPAFQLTETGEVPHVGDILRNLRRPYSADSLDAFFSNPSASLGGQTPRAWLLGGGPPQAVQDLLNSD